MRRPLVSILIPAYNAKEWIADTVRSALAQTWGPKEVIVVDDGSTDGTLDVLQQFSANQVQIVSKQNGGAAAARNTALSISRGEYIQWLDADDLLAPNKIALQIERLSQCESSRTLVSSAWAQFMYRPYKAKFVPTLLWCDLSPVEWLSRKLSTNNYMPNHSWLVSRELTDRAGLWDTTLSIDDDGEYFCRVLLQADRVLFVSEAKVYYRVSGSGTVSSIGLTDRKTTDQWRSMQLHMGYLRSLEDSKTARAACLTFMQDWLHCFIPHRPDIVVEANRVAAELGGALEAPRLKWKYAWIRALMGPITARRAQVFLPRIRLAMARWLDRILLRYEIAKAKRPSQTRCTEMTVDRL